LSRNHSKEACCNNAGLAAKDNGSTVQGNPFELEVHNAEASCFVKTGLLAWGVQEMNTKDEHKPVVRQKVMMLATSAECLGKQSSR